MEHPTLLHRAPRLVFRLAAGPMLAVMALGCENLDRYGPADAANMPATPTGLVAAPASAVAISLAWNPSAGGDGRITYRLFRGGVEIGTTQSSEYQDLGLEPSTAYTYSAVAIDAYGSASAPSTPASATTLASGQSDDTAPTAPTQLTAVAGSATTIGLSWTGSTDDVGVLGYRIYRGGVEIGLSSGTEYTDQGLTPATSYTYTVAAFDGAAHLSAHSASAQATTLPTGGADVEDPSAPTDLAAVPASSSSIGLSWTASTDDVGVLGYRVYRGGVQVGTTVNTSLVDTGLSPATAYTYTVAAFDAAGHQSAQSQPATATTLGAGQSDTEAPSTPILVVAVAAGPNTVLVGWAPSTDNVGVLGYRVFRDGVLAATTSLLAYTDGGLSPSTTYTYTVLAYDAAGNESALSAGASATTLGIGITDTDPPTVPTGLSGLATSVSVTLSWNLSTDNVGVSAYLVYRDGVQIGTSLIPTFTDLGLCPSADFVYTVAARDAAGNVSAQSAPAAITTLNLAVNLGGAANFGVLAGAGLSATGLLPSLINGNAGSSPGISILGLPLLSILGGVLHLGNATAASAQVDLSAALANVAAAPVCAGNDLTGQSLGGLTLTAGVYQYTTGTSLTGTIMLNGGGDPNSVFVIKVNGNLSAAASSNVALINGAQASNVYWVVTGTATVGNNATFRGNLLATGNITTGAGSTVVGRVLSRTGTVAMNRSILGL